jgi:hypothetical protein
LKRNIIQNVLQIYENDEKFVILKYFASYGKLSVKHTSSSPFSESIHRGREAEVQNCKGQRGRGAEGQRGRGAEGQRGRGAEGQRGRGAEGQMCVLSFIFQKQLTI